MPFRRRKVRFTLRSMLAAWLALALASAWLTSPTVQVSAAITKRLGIGMSRSDVERLVGGSPGDYDGVVASVPPRQNTADDMSLYSYWAGPSGILEVEWDEELSHLKGATFYAGGVWVDWREAVRSRLVRIRSWPISFVERSGLCFLLACVFAGCTMVALDFHPQNPWGARMLRASLFGLVGLGAKTMCFAPRLCGEEDDVSFPIEMAFPLLCAGMGWVLGGLRAAWKDKPRHRPFPGKGG